MTPTFSSYFETRCYWNCGPIKRDYSVENITLWPSWLGEGNLHELDNVTVKDWKKFNGLIVRLNREFSLFAPNNLRRTLKPISNIGLFLSGYRDSQNKSSSEFSTFVIPELNAVIEEHWDYTWLLHYKYENTLVLMSRIVRASGLHHFPVDRLKTVQGRTDVGHRSGVLKF